MKLIPTACLAVLFVLPVCVLADDSADPVEVIYWGSTPKLFRVDVRVEGEPPSRMLHSVIRAWVAFYDRDDDGKLNALEVRKMPNLTSFNYIQQTGNYYPRGKSGLDITDLNKTPRDKVTVDELVAYYSKDGKSGAIRLAQTYNRPSSMQSTQWLFKAMDADDDGKLSKKELTSGIQLVRKYDANDDEMLVASEIPGGSTTTARRPVVRRSGRIVQQQRRAPFQLVLSESDRAKLPELLLSKYDRDGSGGLNQKELGLTKKEFAKLDADGDGELTTTETKLWRTVVKAPKVELPIGTEGAMGMEMKKGTKGAGGIAQLKKLKQSKTSFLTGDAKIAFQVARSYSVRRANVANMYLRLFEQANKKKKKYLTMVDLVDRRYTYLRSVFGTFDKNGDRKLTEAEIKDFSNLVQRSKDQYVSIKFQSEGRQLFTVLDGNRDGRLTMRELLSAWDNLKIMDLDKDGKISEEEFPREFTVYVAQGRMIYVANRNNPGGPRTIRRSVGPLWFQRMDANGDGDVSQREFLGDRQIFERLDSNSDGLIDAVEANKASQKSSS